MLHAQAASIALPHITSMKLPMSVQVRQGSLDAIEDQEIAVVCAAGIRSAQAAVRLTRVFKFKHVKNVGGGMNEWTQKGYPVE